MKACQKYYKNLNENNIFFFFFPLKTSLYVTGNRAPVRNNSITAKNYYCWELFIVIVLFAHWRYGQERQGLYTKRFGRCTQGTEDFGRGTKEIACAGFRCSAPCVCSISERGWNLEISMSIMLYSSMWYMKHMDGGLVRLTARKKM